MAAPQWIDGGGSYGGVDLPVLARDIDAPILFKSLRTSPHPDVLLDQLVGMPPPALASAVVIGMSCDAADAEVGEAYAFWVVDPSSGAVHLTEPIRYAGSSVANFVLRGTP